MAIATVTLWLTRGSQRSPGRMRLPRPSLTCSQSGHAGGNCLQTLSHVSHVLRVTLLPCEENRMPSAALLLLLLGFSPPCSSLHRSWFIGLSPMIPFMLLMRYLTPPDANTNGEGLKKITRGKSSVATSCTGRHFSLLFLLLSILFAQQQRRLIMICFRTDRKDPEV